MRTVLGLLCVCALGAVPLIGCGETAGTGGGGGSAGSGGVDASAYAAKDLWLCRPDIENDRCDTADLTMTEVRPDGTLLTSNVAPNADAKVDCFYVYHTVNDSPVPGNTETLFPHPENVIGAVFRNGAHYRGVCRVFAPLYHQMTLSTYFEHAFQWQETEFFQTAYGDVVEAFEYYMRNHNEGRDFVLIGHSQGSHILKRLLQDQFDNDEVLRGQLVSAVLIGPTSAIHVPDGERTGGSFENIPLCESATETGCVIAFDANPAGVSTFWDTSTVIPSGMVRACVNPASFDDGPGTLAALIYPRTYETLIPFPDGVDTEWVRYPNIYTSRCSERRARPGHVLEVDLSSEYTGDVPISPQELQGSLVEVWGAAMNLHSAEYFLANTDLVRIVEQQIESREN